MLPPPPTSTLFPYTTLFRSEAVRNHQQNPTNTIIPTADARNGIFTYVDTSGRVQKVNLLSLKKITLEDRKSTRLNSSHLGISYAVFCLKKKKKTKSNKLTQE